MLVELGFSDELNSVRVRPTTEWMHTRALCLSSLIIKYYVEQPARIGFSKESEESNYIPSRTDVQEGDAFYRHCSV